MKSSAGTAKKRSDATISVLTDDPHRRLTDCC
jgi:hypothetical protein